jgi:hypothetical protein
VSQAFHGDLCAHANSANQAFWQLDFRPRALICLAYVLRLNLCEAFPRSWTLQGSQDGSDWVELHAVHDSQEFQRAGQLGVWCIDAPLMRWVSLVRVMLCDPAGPSQLNVNYVELYGYVK